MVCYYRLRVFLGVTGADVKNAFHRVGANRRKFPRHRALLAGRVAYGTTAFTLGCTIRDISEGGARIKLPAGQTVPNKVYLIDVRKGCAYEASVVWRRTPEVGLSFSKQHFLAEIEIPRLRFLRRIWIDASVRSGE
jgi:hypothetical protein